jgi:hypothetical protein
MDTHNDEYHDATHIYEIYLKLNTFTYTQTNKQKRQNLLNLFSNARISCATATIAFLPRIIGSRMKCTITFSILRLYTHVRKQRFRVICAKTGLTKRGLFSFDLKYKYKRFIDIKFKIQFKIEINTF